MTVGDEDTAIVVEATEDPVLVFGDATRNHQHGTLWIWGRTGRPMALLELFQWESTNWHYVFNQLSGEAVVAERDNRRCWIPSGTRVRFLTIDGSIPGDQPAERDLEMRKLAQRFAAHEFWDPDNSRYELRLLSRPVHEYAVPEEGVSEGGVFVFANGTNPEVALLLEARVDDEGARSWWYGLARAGHAEIHVSLDAEEVWKVPRAAQTAWTSAYSYFATGD
jgi:hypothetical protein